MFLYRCGQTGTTTWNHLIISSSFSSLSKPRLKSHFKIKLKYQPRAFICCTFMQVLYVYLCIPACSQICARVIQGCRGPCLGALLCSEEATSDRACSTRLAAIDVAWTEPGGRESNHHTRHLPEVLTYYHGSVRQPRATMQGFNSAKHNSRFHWFPRLQTGKRDFSVKPAVFGCSKKLKTLGPHWHTASCSCTKAFNHSTATHCVTALD